ncbi:MAG: c-type cytochrome [Labilithrix sp.]|nr:c-type cytochrome [Labilithrix sp.]
MKKWIVRILGGLLGLVALAVIGVLVKFYVLSPKTRAAADMRAPTTPEAIARGKYLTHNVAACVGCHSPVQEGVPGEPPVEGKLGAGRDFGALPGFPGRLRAPNITPDGETGLGKWTDGEIVRAMREGVSRDGRPLFPQMPFVTYASTLTDEDALAIVAYLKTLSAVKNDPGRLELSFPVSMFVRAVPKPVEAAAPPPPSPSDKLARGRWLLAVCSCNDCHDKVNERMQKLPGGALAGGARFPLPDDKGVAIASNITSDKATGIGAYSDDDLRRVFDEGKNKAGRLLYVMPWSYYGGLTRDDKEALIAALREVPPIANLVPPSQIK